MRRGAPNGKEHVWKACARKGLQVRVLSPPPVGKCSVWLALCEGSPADFKRKLEFFIFAPLLRGWPKAGFSKFLLIKFILFGSIVIEVIISFTIILPKLYQYDKWKNNQRKYQENAG